ncbi:hypothetical protein GGX14DRAFT_469569 [Mycena pura]|uniref:Uncharacterized protein n=1 Tax=Mycena pura TaxID=153505 RepID=A0AAD6UYX1_9AGAR|nr:hypothetical protein GGX14DRAFT_469569 [Mycena pura]
MALKMEIKITLPLCVSAPTMIPTPPASSSIPAPRFIATHHDEPKPKAPKQKRLPKKITTRLQDFFDHTSARPTTAQYNALLEEIRKRQASGSAKPKVSSPPQHNSRYPTLTPDVLQKLDNVWTSVPPDKRHQLYYHWTHVAYADAGASPEDVERWLKDRECADAGLCVDTTIDTAHAYSTPAPTTTSESPVPRWRDSPCSARAVSTYLPPTPTSSRAPSLVLKSEPAASPVTPFSSLPPLPIPPSIGLRILEAVKREMDEDKLFPGPESHLPHNYAEFEAMFQPWEDKIHLVLKNLQDIHWHPSVGS